RQWCIEITSFRGNLKLFMASHKLHRPHIMQTVGKLNENHTDIIGKGEEHLAEVLRLHRAVRIKDPGYLGQPIDNPNYLFPELLLNFRKGNTGVFYHVV